LVVVESKLSICVYGENFYKKKYSEYMVQFAVDLIDQLGLIGAAALIAIEVVILPIPSELILLLTGFNVSLNRFIYIVAILATTIGSLVGALFLYWMGYAFSEERLEFLVTKYGKYVGVKLTDLQKTANWFERHGAQLVFFGRLIPLIRSLVSVPAGLTEMKLSRFILFTTLGSATWNTIWITLGLFLGARWQEAEKYTKYLDLVVYAGIAVVAVLFLFKTITSLLKLRKNRQI
jgi:membrane protein DedA with SNARE-associated domain